MQQSQLGWKINIIHCQTWNGFYVDILSCYWYHYQAPIATQFSMFISCLQMHSIIIDFNLNHTLTFFLIASQLSREVTEIIPRNKVIEYVYVMQLVQLFLPFSSRNDNKNSE